MARPAQLAQHGSVGVITMESPPVNALGLDLRIALKAALAEANARDDISVIMLTGSGGTFSGGGDITEFGAPPKPPLLIELIAELENSAKPVVSLLNGTTLGGGLELALATEHRCAFPGARMGLPEVRLGLLPGAGGTQRLPRLTGAEAALEMITSGRQVPAAEAERLGLVDGIVETFEQALSWATERVAAVGHRRTRDLDVSAPEDLFANALAKEERRSGKFPAPTECIKAVRAATQLPFDEGLEFEREAFLRLRESPQSQAQRHRFFAERAAARIKDMPDGIEPRTIRTAGVIGAGTMGAGIAMSLANAGVPTILVETNGEALERGLKRINEIYAASVAKGRMSAEDKIARQALIRGVLEMEALADADLVIEAVFEDMGIKTEIFSALDRICKPGAILATNTSTLDVNVMAAATSRPEDVVGMHFFSPANVMKLLEVVRASQTSHEVLATVMGFGKRIGKISVCVGVCDGFVGNRMFLNYNREAQVLVEQGALPEQVDRVLTEWGMAMGPFAVMDLAGTDVGWRIRQAREATRDKSLPYPYTVADRLATSGRYGQKAGRGWYRYEAGSRKPHVCDEVTRMIEDVSREKGIVRRSFDDEEVLHRLLWQLVNTGAQILDEGIAQRPGDIDVIYLNGYGFPAHKGGPMFDADRTGLGRIYRDVCRFAAENDAFWEPAPLLKRLAESGGAFADL